MAWEMQEAVYVAHVGRAVRGMQQLMPELLHSHPVTCVHVAL